MKLHAIGSAEHVQGLGCVKVHAIRVTFGRVDDIRRTRDAIRGPQNLRHVPFE
jgi:hypothetical protein